MAIQRGRIGSLTMAALLVFCWSVAVGIPPRAPRPVQAAQTNSYSTFGTVSYDPGSCGRDETASVVSAPGIKKIVKVSNTEIYVVGCFLNFGGAASADYVAKWDGSSWSGLGASGDINAIVHDATFYKGNLHIAGEFTDAGGDVAADMVAQWNGSAWVGLPVTGGTNVQDGLGSPKDKPGDVAAALKVQENGAGTSDDILLVGGLFSYGINNGTSGFSIANTQNIATWDGTNWGSLDTDSDPYPTTTQTDYVVHDIEIIGSNTYISGYRNSSTFSSSNKTYLFHKFDGTSWTRPVTTVDAAYFGTGFGVYSMEVVGTNLLIGGTFTNLSNVANHLALYNTTSGTFSAFNSFAPTFGTGAVVRAISYSGSQTYVGGSFPGVTGTSGGVAVWSGSEWQGIGRNAPAVVNALQADLLYSFSNSRLMIGAAGLNIGGVATADGFANLAIDSSATLDSVAIDAGTMSPSFSSATGTYSVALPNASASVTLTVLASSSGASIKRTNSSGTLALSSDNETLNVSAGASETISFAVRSVDGISTQTYTFNVTRAAAAQSSSSSSSTSPPSSSSTTAAPAPESTTIPASPITAAPNAPVIAMVSNVVKHGGTASKTTLLKLAKTTVPSGGKYALKIASTYAKVCRVSGTGVKTLKAGTCKVSITITPKTGRASTKTVTLKVT